MAVIQTAYGVGSATFASPPTETNRIVACCTGAVMVAAPALGGFTLIDRVSYGSDGSAGMWRRQVTDDESGVTTGGNGLTYQAGAVGDRITLIEVDGNYLDSVAQEERSGTDIDCGGPITPTEGPVTIIGVAGLSDTNTTGSATPYSGVHEVTDVATTHPFQWVGYRNVSTAGGTYSIGGTYNASRPWAGVTAVFAAPAGTAPGVWGDWDGSGFQDETSRCVSFDIRRGASPELTGGSQPGSATFLFSNYLNGVYDGRFNPENASGPLYGLLHDGVRMWAGVNDDGTVVGDGHDVIGLHAGYITDISLLEDGGKVAFTEVVTEDPLGWASRQKVTLPDSRTRSQADVRLAILTQLGWSNIDVPAEPTTLPLSSFDGMASNGLDALGASNGTRHFIKPHDTRDLWFTYTAIRRTDHLDGVSGASLSASSEHVTGTSGWRRSADGIINQQRASVEPIGFSALREVWQADTPLPVITTTPYVLWVEFDDFVDDPVVDVATNGSALASVTIEPFGHTAKVTLVSTGTSPLSVFSIQGHAVIRSAAASVVIDDTASQAEPRGVRAGSDLTGDYLGTLTAAQGFAEHIVWRFANPLYRPTITITNWMPEMFSLDIGDVISFTSTVLGVADRLFEIVGWQEHCDLAARDGGGNAVVSHQAVWVLQEAKVQAVFEWIVLDDSETDGSAVLAY